MSLSALNADDRVAQLLTLTEQLTGRLDAETRAFEARRPQDVVGAVEETARLANLYRHESARLKRDPETVRSAAPALLKTLAAATQAFEAVLARHGRALDAARNVTEGLVRAVAEEVAAARPQAAGYGPGARASAGLAASAITLNRRA